ncbi:hypothetical protein LBMAG55_14490 [Verrucomicrobiota bacterium]|nr:hypothetical protein LBMAG55_14490 [Verrucomicrobiota bacterium]
MRDFQVGVGQSERVDEARRKLTRHRADRARGGIDVQELHRCEVTDAEGKGKGQGADRESVIGNRFKGVGAGISK